MLLSTLEVLGGLLKIVAPRPAESTMQDLPVQPKSHPEEEEEVLRKINHHQQVQQGSSSSRKILFPPLLDVSKDPFGAAT